MAATIGLPETRNMRNRLLALLLFITAPLVAEYLLGDLSLSDLPSLLVMAPLYGGAAVVIRETARRFGLRWPAIALLALAYGVVEEGVMTQSLFNPDYANAHLLEFGFVPALGIAIPWTLYVLCLHTVWSISAPIALIEELSGRDRVTPWFGKLGLTIMALLTTLAAVAITVISYLDGGFWASPSQLVVVAVVAVVLVGLAFRLPRTVTRRPGTSPKPWWPLLLSLAAGVVFELLSWRIGKPALSVVSISVAIIATLFAVTAWSRRAGWGARHRVALASGAVLTYVWHRFWMDPVTPASEPMILASSIVFGLAALALLLAAVHCARNTDHAAEQESDAATDTTS